MTDFDDRLTAIAGNIHADQPLTQADAWWLLMQVIRLNSHLDYMTAKAKELARGIERSRDFNATSAH